MSDLPVASERALAGGPERHRAKAREQGKLPVRERIEALVDEGSFAEEGLLAGWQEEGLGAEGVVTGVGSVEGRPTALMANDPTVKAGRHLRDPQPAPFRLHFRLPLHGRPVEPEYLAHQQPVPAIRHLD